MDSLIFMFNNSAAWHQSRIFSRNMVFSHFVIYDAQIGIATPLPRRRGSSPELISWPVPIGPSCNRLAA
jgi:hypothetical protein